jgi:hypothetical protein
MRTGGKQWEGTWTGGLCVESASERVDVRRLEQRTRVWQPESSVEGSRWCRDFEGPRVWQTLGAWWKARD